MNPQPSEPQSDALPIELWPPCAVLDRTDVWEQGARGVYPLETEHDGAMTVLAGRPRAGEDERYRDGEDDDVDKRAEEHVR